MIILFLGANMLFAQTIGWVRTGGFYMNDSAAERIYDAFLIDDFNGDGYPEAVVIGSHMYFDFHSNDFLRFFWGGTGILDTIPDFEITIWDTIPDPPYLGIIENAEIIGDINGDGYNDLAIGMPRYTDECMTYNCGKVFVYFGGPDMDTICDWSFSSSEHYYHYLGSYVNGLGDWNSDGYDDFMVNGSWDDVSALGRIYIFFGGSPLSLTPAKVICGPSEGYSLGGCVVGDIDGDSLSDIITGGWTEEGIEYSVIKGHTNVDSVFLETFFSAPEGHWFTPVGDINGDGKNDVFFELYELEFSILTDISPLTMTPFDYSHWYAGLCLIKDIGDVNSDGIDDIYVFDRMGDYSDFVSYTSILAGDTALDFTEIYSSESLWGAIDIGKDLNGDGYPEAIVMDYIQIRPDSAYYWYDLITLNVYYANIDNKPIFKPDEIRISAYPNPFNSAVMIALDWPGVETQDIASLQIEVFDINGRMVEKIPLNPPLTRGTSDSPLVKGGQGGIITWQPAPALGSGV